MIPPNWGAITKSSLSEIGKQLQSFDSQRTVLLDDPCGTGLESQCCQAQVLVPCCWCKPRVLTIDTPFSRNWENAQSFARQFWRSNKVKALKGAPTLLYDLCRLERPWLNDLYAYLGAGTENERNALKVAVNVLLNARTKKAAIGALEKELPKYVRGWGAREIVQKIEQKLSSVKHMFCCNNVSTGLWLQNVESEIMSKVVSNFVAANAPLLPVHDSVIVREKDVDTLVQSMGKYYCELVEEYTDKEWADNLSVHMKIFTKSSSKLLTFKGGVVYNKFM